MFISLSTTDNVGLFSFISGSGRVEQLGLLDVAMTGEDAVDGLVGLDLGTGLNVTNSYWDTETSGQSSRAGGTGQTTTELQSPTGYTGIYENWNIDVDRDSSPDSP